MDFLNQEKLDPSQELENGLNASRQQSNMSALTTFDKTFMLDQTKVKNLLESDPDGPEHAFQKIIGTAFYSKVMDMDPDAVYQSFDRVAEMYHEKTMETPAPMTWKYLSDNWTARSAQGEAAMLGDQLKTMRDIEKFNKGKNAEYDKAILQKEQDMLARIAELKKQGQTLSFKGNNLEWIDSAATFAQSIAESMLSEEGMAGFGIGGLAGALGAKATLGTKSVLQGGKAVKMLATGSDATRTAAGLTMAGAFGGLQAGAAVSMGKQEAGSVYLDLIESGVNHDIASPISNTVGVINGLLESVQLRTLSGIADGVLMGQVKKAIADGTKKAVANKALTGGVTSLLARHGVNVLENTTQEVLQESMAILGTAIGQAFDAENVPLEKRIQGHEAINRILETARVAAMGSAVLGLPGAVYQNSMDANEAKNAGYKILDAANENPGISPEVRQATITSLLAGQDRTQVFYEKQADETQATAFTEPDSTPTTFYHAQDQGAPVFYRDAVEAAESMDDFAVGTPETFVQAVAAQYGKAAGDWINTVLEGNEVYSETAKAEIGNKYEAIKAAALETRRGQFDYRVMTEKTKDTLEQLKINVAAPKLVAAHIDARNVWTGTEAEYNALPNKSEYEAYDLGDRVILARGKPELIVPIGTAETSSVRLPTRNGKLLTEETETEIRILDPQTKAPIASIQRDGDTIKELPENPVHARQALRMLQSQGKPIILDISMQQRDAILSTDKGYKRLAQNLADLQQSKAALSAELRTTDMDQMQLEAIEAQAAELGKAEQKAIDELYAYEAEIFGEQALSALPMDSLEETAKSREIDNQDAAEEVKARLVTAAPQLEKFATVLVRLMEITANNQGKTLAQWKSVHLKPEVFTSTAFEDKQRGAVNFDPVDGKALIMLTEQSDPSTVIHEFGHIVRRTLDAKDQAILLKAYNATSWTVDAEEAFTKDWEAYFIDGKAPTKGLEAIMARIARIMREVYGYVRTMIKPEVRQVIDRAITMQVSTNKALMATEDMLFHPDMATVDRLVNMEPVQVETVAVPETKRGAWAKQYLGQVVSNKDTGRNIYLSKAAGKKVSTHSGNPEVLSIIPSLKALVENAIYLDFSENIKRERKPNLRGVNHYATIALVSGKERLITFNTNIEDGKEYLEQLDNWEVEEQKAEPTRQSEAGGTAFGVSEAHKNRIVQLLREVNHPEFLFQPAYHGTPHRFDRFTTAAMGTGEGVQAYGWGLYFAGKKEIADHYRKNVKDKGAIKSINEEIKRIANELEQHTGAEYGKYKSPKGYELKAEYESLLEKRNEIRNAPGQLYKVEIPDQDDFLDWDKPLSEQSEKVQKAIRAYLMGSESDIRDFAQPYEWPNTTGSAFYMAMGTFDFLSPEQASKKLKSLGIPGITFLDGASRATGEGNYNYVIFDEADIEIVETFYQPEYTFPEETKAIRERMDQIEAKGEQATDADLAEYGELYKASKNIIDTWLYTLKTALDSGELVPDTAIVEAADYATWAQDELDMRRAFGGDFNIEDIGTDPGVSAEDIGDTEITQDKPKPANRKEYEAEFLADLETRGEQIAMSIREVARSWKQVQEQGFALDEIMAAQLHGMKPLIQGGPMLSFIAAKDPYKKRKGSSKVLIEIALESLRLHPGIGMELAAYADGDLNRVAEIDELNKREPIDQTPEALEEAERERIRQLPFDERMDRLRTILGSPFHKVDAEKIEEMYSEVSLELRRLSAAHAGKVSQLSDLERRFTAGERAYRQVRSELQVLGKELIAIKSQAATMERNQTAEIDALRARREQLKSEVAKLKGQVKAAIREKNYAVQWTRAEERAKAARQVAQEANRIKEMQQRRDDLRKAREYKRSLIKEIGKKIPKSVDYRYAIQIQTLQELIKPKKEQASAVKALKWYAENPDFLRKVMESLGKEPELEPIFEKHTVQQLEEILEQIIVLEIEGKAVRKEYDDGETSKVVSARRAMYNRLIEENGNVNRVMDIGNNDPGRLEKIAKSFEEMQHILDQLDGGALNYDGPFWKNVYAPVQMAADSMKYHQARRTNKLKQIMNDLVIGQTELYKKLEIDGKPYLLSAEKVQRKRVIIFEEALTIETAIGIYMARQNEESAKAITYGNLINPTQQMKIVELLPEKFKKLGDAIIEQIFDTDYDRLANVSNRVTNINMGRADRYYPMVRQKTGGEAYEETLAWEAQARAGTKRKPADGITKDRVVISDKMQTKIRLDAIALTVETIDKQERFIAYIELSKRINRIFHPKGEGKPFVDALDTVRKGTTRQILEWAGRTVNGAVSRDDVMKFLAASKMNMSSYAMGFNNSTSLKSIAGLPLYMSEAGTFQLLKMTGAAFTQMNSYKKRMHRLAPQLDNRRLDTVEALSRSFKNATQYRIAGFKKAGFFILKEVIHAVDAIGWNAVFETKLAQGMTEQDAANQATAALHRTQPSGELFALSAAESNPVVSIIAPFASQAFKIFNQLTHLPNVKKAGAVKRYISKAVAAGASVVVFTTVIQFVVGSVMRLAGDEPDEEKKDNLARGMLANAVSSFVPIIGGPIASIIDGFSPGGIFDTQLKAVGALTRLFNNIDDLDENDMGYISKSSAESFSSIAGLPYISFKRMMQAIEAEDEEAYLRIIHALVGGTL